MERTMNLPRAFSSMNRRDRVRRETDRRLLKRDRQLGAARHITEALFLHLDTETLITKALETAVTLVDAESGSILLADPDTQHLVFRHSLGNCPAPQGAAIPWDQGIAGEVYQSGRVILIQNAQEDPRHCQSIDKATGHITRDLLALPLKRWEGEAIGVLEVLNKRESQLNEDDIEILTIVSAIAATAIEQARRFQEAKLAEVAGMLGNISHDINNLLMPVVCGTSVLASTVQGVLSGGPIVPEHHKVNYELCADVIGIISKSTRRIQDRVKEIADCVKGRSSPAELRACCLDEIIVSVFATLRGVATENGIALQQNGLNELPKIMADERRLFSGFYNLVHNALAEVPAGGSITVSGRERSSAFIRIMVTDTGRGMPPDVLENLFTARAKSRKPGGTGLGMRIVKDVVESHRGRITVKSKEGIGTTFTIDLPIFSPSEGAVD
jgi:signal transduction histidine kinase